MSKGSKKEEVKKITIAKKPSTVGDTVTSKTTGNSKPTLPNKRKHSESSGSSYKRVGESRMKHTEESSAEPIDEDDEESKSQAGAKKRNQKVAAKKIITS
jgi:hypothetical protein